MLARGESMRALITQIRDGGSIGLLLDLSMEDGEPVPFFGHPMRTSLTPARMALRYGCDIVPMRTERLGAARFRVTAYPPVALDATGVDEDARSLAIARRLNATMETVDPRATRRVDVREPALGQSRCIAHCGGDLPIRGCRNPPACPPRVHRVEFAHVCRDRLRQ